MTLFVDVQNCFKELEIPENVEESLLELSQMDIPKEVLDKTNACWLIMFHFEHPTSGDLARKLAMDWMKIRSPKMPALLFSREADTEDAVPHKRRRISEEKECFESVNANEDDAEEEFNPFLTENSHGKTSFTCTESNKENAPEPSMKKSKTELCKEANIGSRLVKKPASPPLALSTSSSSNPAMKKADEARLEEISLKIAQKKAEKEAKHRKTVIIAEHDYTNTRRRAHMSK